MFCLRGALNSPLAPCCCYPRRRFCWRGIAYFKEAASGVVISFPASSLWLSLSPCSRPTLLPRLPPTASTCLPLGIEAQTDACDPLAVKCYVIECIAHRLEVMVVVGTSQLKNNNNNKQHKQLCAKLPCPCLLPTSPP